ncbi:MAG: cation:proton antiporter [Actinomycetota bacterium]
MLAVLPTTTRFVIRRVGHRVSEPEIKFLLAVLIGLGALAAAAGSEAVLPAYVAGLVIAGIFLHDRVLIDRMRSICFALLTPFFFLRAGLLISAPALASGAGVIALLLGVKLTAKGIGVWPTARAFGIPGRERTYLTLLMSTGLTFGSIAALFGLTNGLISQQQYSELVMVVILSTFVPPCRSASVRRVWGRLWSFEVQEAARGRRSCPRAGLRTCSHRAGYVPAALIACRRGAGSQPSPSRSVIRLTHSPA